jgi:hypothetical protein
MGSAGKDLVETSGKLTESLGKNADALKLVGSSGTDSFNSLSTTVEQTSTAMSGFVETSIGSIGQFIRQGVADGKFDFGTLKDAVVGNFTDMLEDGAKSFVTNALESITGFKTDGTTAFGDFGTFVTGIFGGASTDADTAKANIVTSMSSASADSQTVFGTLKDYVTSAFSTLWENIKDFGPGLSKMFGDMGDAVGKVFDGLGTTISDLFSGIAGWASDAFTSLGDTFDGLVKGISSGLGKVTGWLGDIGKSITDVTGDLGTLLGNAGMGAGIGGAVGGLIGGKNGGIGGTIGGAIGSVAAGSAWFAGTGLGQLLGSWAGPVGGLAGGLVGSLLGGLFSQKPSDKMMSATVSYRSGSITALGGNLSGEKYSKANQDAAKQIANTIGTMARKLQKATGGYLVDGISVEVGSRDGIKLHMEKDAKPVKFGSTSELLNAAFQHMLTKLKGGDLSKISTIKFATGTDSVFTRRTLLEVGEAGPERVQVSKLGGSYGSAGMGGTTIQIMAPIYTTGLTHNRLMQDIVKEAERENFRRRGRRLA